MTPAAGTVTQARAEHEMPEAFLGYEIGDPPVIHCCAWCESKNELDAWTIAHGCRVSHGICSRHVAEFTAKRMGER